MSMTNELRPTAYLPFVASGGAISTKKPPKAANRNATIWTPRVNSFTVII
jgi:hypothetical protein